MDQTFHETQLQEDAAAFLGSQEKIIWYSNAKNQTLPATRLHFLKQLALYPSTAAEEKPYYTDVYYDESGKWPSAAELARRNREAREKTEKEREKTAARRRDRFSELESSGTALLGREAGLGEARVKMEEDRDEEGEAMDVDEGDFDEEDEGGVSLSPAARSGARSGSGEASSSGGRRNKKRKSGSSS